MFQDSTGCIELKWYWSKYSRTSRGDILEDDEISFFPNIEFYGNRLMNGLAVEMEPDGYSYLKSEMYGAYAFINVTDGREETDDFGKSKRNLVEAVVVLYMLSKLYKGNFFSV